MLHGILARVLSKNLRMLQTAILLMLSAISTTYQRLSCVAKDSAYDVQAGKECCNCNTKAEQGNCELIDVSPITLSSGVQGSPAMEVCSLLQPVAVNFDQALNENKVGATTLLAFARGVNACSPEGCFGLFLLHLRLRQQTSRF